LAGSYLIEQLTDEIEDQAIEYIQKIDDMGGALAAIERGYQQSEIQEAAYQYQQAVERQEQIVVGVNKFEVEEQLDLDQLKVDPAIEEGQRARLVAIRARRDAQKVAELLGRLEAVANGDENLVPLFVECVENDLTLGEICGVLRKVWGEYQPSTWI
jgi:methylmalonyl-CoA mutase N-terminal domain/subunit